MKVKEESTHIYIYIKTGKKIFKIKYTNTYKIYCNKQKYIYAIARQVNGKQNGQLFNLVPSYSLLGCQDIPTEERTLEEEMKEGRKSPEQTLPTEGLVNAQVQEGGCV